MGQCWQGFGLMQKKSCNTGEAAAVILAAAGLFLSLWLSVHIYEKQEF